MEDKEKGSGVGIECLENTSTPLEKDIFEDVEDQGIDVENVALADAVKDLSPWGRGYLKLYGYLLLIALCSTMNGFDGSLMGSINAVPSYTAYYHLPSTGSASTGLVFSIYQIGQMVGALFVWTADWRGRKLAIFIGVLGVCAGAIVTATSPTLGGFIAGRFVLAMFSSIAQTAAPLLLIEIAPPQYRASVSGIYNTLYYMGAILAAGSVYGSFNSTSPAFHDTLLEWRLSLWLQLVCPGIVVFGIWICPESPRWLAAKGRVQEARVTIANLHTNGAVEHPLVHLEMAEITKSVQEEGMARWNTIFDLRDMVRSPNRRYRLMLCIAFSWFGQFSGNNMISYYLPSLVKAVGLTSTSQQLLINLLYAVIGWIFAIAGAFLHDIFGRRKMFLTTTLGLIVALAITTGTTADYVHTGSRTASDTSIAFIFIFGAVFAIGYTAMQPIYPGEVMTNDMRAKGMAIFQLTAGCAGFVNTFAAPIALKNIGYWFYAFFVFWDCFEWLFIYFFFVETKGRTLEELDEVFDAKNPRKASVVKTTIRKRIVVDRSGEMIQEVMVL